MSERPFEVPYPYVEVTKKPVAELVELADDYSRYRTEENLNRLLRRIHELGDREKPGGHVVGCPVHWRC